MRVSQTLLTIFPAMLLGLFVSDVFAQQSTYQSRYRFVDDRVTQPEKSEASALVAKRLPSKSQASVAPTAFQQPVESVPAVPAQPNYEIDAPIPQGFDQQAPGVRDDQEMARFFDQERYNRARNRYIPTPVQVIPPDVYRTFPADSPTIGLSTSLFQGDLNCCDEWAGLCRMKNLDYRTNCGGLKQNPGHLGMPWLRGCDNCESNCGTGRCGDKVIQSRCGKSCLSKTRDRIVGLQNERHPCGCKACLTHDRGLGNNGCENGCYESSPAPAIGTGSTSILETPTSTSCGCADCQSKKDTDNQFVDRDPTLSRQRPGSSKSSQSKGLLNAKVPTFKGLFR